MVRCVWRLYGSLQSDGAVGFSFGEWVIWGLLTSQSGSAGFLYFPAVVLLSLSKMVILFESIYLRVLCHELKSRHQMSHNYVTRFVT